MENDQSYELSFEQLRQMEDAQQPPSKHDPPLTKEWEEPAESGEVTVDKIYDIIFEADWTNEQGAFYRAATAIYKLYEPLQRVKENLIKANTLLTKETVTASETISKLEAEIAELKKNEPSVSKEWEE